MQDLRLGEQYGRDVGPQRAPMSVDAVFEGIGKTIDGVGVAVTAIGSAYGLGVYAGELLRRQADEASYRTVRRRIGRSILLGLELLVAGDIIRSVVVSPSFVSVGVLGLIVLIRSFLSVTLEVEISGQLPWRRQDEPGREP